MSWLAERKTAIKRQEDRDRAWHDANRAALPERANQILDALWRTIGVQERCMELLTKELNEARGGKNPDARHDRPEEVVAVKVGRHRVREIKR
jgi:hypothetical protein